MNRVDELGTLLASLAHANAAQAHIVIVDQNTDDRLATTVAAWSQRLALTHLRIPPRGVSQARNAGLAHLGDAGFVAFPDDDCRYEPDTLAEAEGAFASTPQADVLVSGWYGLGRPRPEMPSDSSVRRLDRFRVLRRSPTYTLFLRRSAVEQAGEFDELLGPGGGTPWLCGEDADYLLRAGGLNGRAWHTPRVLVSHPEIEHLADRSKAFGYGRGRMRVLMKHRYPLWFQAASVLHPAAGALLASGPARRFRWRLFRGRLHEWFSPFSANGG